MFPRFVFGICFRNLFSTFVLGSSFRNSFSNFVSEVCFRCLFSEFVSELAFNICFGNFFSKLVSLICFRNLFSKLSSYHLSPRGIIIIITRARREWYRMRTAGRRTKLPKTCMAALPLPGDDEPPPPARTPSVQPIRRVAFRDTEYEGVFSNPPATLSTNGVF